MLHVAIMTTGSGMAGIVPKTFEEATHLLIVDAETMSVVNEIGSSIVAYSPVYFAKKMDEYECEVVLCGTIEKPAFEVIAEAGITRMYAAGLDVLTAIRAMNTYQLGYITDHVGGSGCPGHDNPGDTTENCHCDEA